MGIEYIVNMFNKFDDNLEYICVFFATCFLVKIFLLFIICLFEKVSP